MNHLEKPILNPQLVRRRFERAADSFDAADFVHAHTREGLLSRLQPLLIDAKTIVDLGSATGSAQQALARRFNRPHIISVDVAHMMLQKARKKKAWFAKASYVQASAGALPFPDESIDVIFSNLLLPWVDNPAPVFSEVARVLRKGGLFAFATLGPDSLQEIRRAWGKVDNEPHTNRFLDMHDLGDGLVNAGLRDPVLDVDRLTVSYTSSARLFQDLTATGGRNTLAQRRRTLTGKRRFATMVAELEGAAADGEIRLDLELVFGHCWGGGPKSDPANYRIDATEIPLRRR